MLMAFKKVYFGTGKFKWVKLRNFVIILEGGDFFKSFWWTLFYGASSTLLLLIIGMYFALLLNRKMPGRNFIRGLLLMPWAIPVFVNAFLWLWLLNIQYGLVNYILMSLKILKEPLHWTGGKFIAKISVLLAYIWRVFPFNMIVYLAAFQTIDPMYYEAAEIDGANKVRQFFHVTLPQVKNIVTFTALLNFIWAFQEFTTIWIMTRGGPAGATNTLMTQVYTLSFLQRNFGEAAATGVLWIIFLILFAIFYLRVLFFRKDFFT
jgi:multiple sugar transport system permease protein